MAQNRGTTLYTDAEIKGMAACFRQSEAVQLEAIRVMVEAGHTQAFIRQALKLSRRTWFRRWKRYRSLMEYRGSVC